MWSLIEVKTQPVKHTYQVLDGAFYLACLIRILNSQDTLTTVLLRKQVVVQRGAQPTDMQISSRAGCVTGAHGHALPRFWIIATASAAMPSLRPVNPIRSNVVPLMDMFLESILNGLLSAACISATYKEIRGSSHITLTSTLTVSNPSRSRTATTSASSNVDAMPL